MCFFIDIRLLKIGAFHWVSGGIRMPLGPPLSVLPLDCRGDGLLHRRRRLRPRHGRRKHHRAQAGNHLPGRTPAGGARSSRALAPRLWACACLTPSLRRCWQVRAATGEEVSAEDLGGADLHCKYDPGVRVRQGGRLGRLQTLSNVFLFF